MSSPPRPAGPGHARFDDLRPGRRRSFEMRGYLGSIVAAAPDEVPATLAAVERATADGVWAAGVVAYEAAPGLDPALHVSGGPTSLPAAWFGLYSDRGPATPLAHILGEYRLGSWSPSVGRASYLETVARIRELIAAGDTYQVNYAMRLRTSFAGDGLALYRDLAQAQSAGYGAYLEMDDHLVVSASPELFFEWAGDTLTTRPMKGTAPRGRWTAEDEQRRAALVASEKDRAENLMIVDLLRNDMGRISEIGSVRVDELFAAERFDTVWQLTSTIRSTLRPEVGLGDIFGALFPCGSITGAPKVRTMQIIADLEQERRGVYCGAVGFVAPRHAPGPRAAFNVAIRTIEIDRAAREARYGVGGGITYDSTPAGEYEEALVKTRVLGRAEAPFELLETMRWEPDHGWWWLDRHLDRIEDAAAYFGIRLDREGLTKVAHAAVDGASQPQRVRLLVGRRGEPRAVAAPFTPASSPQRVALDDHPVDRADPFLYHKTTRRERYQAARARHPGADDVLLVNDRGEITESTVANVAAWLDNAWVTPQIEAGCLPGIQRQVLLEEGQVVPGRVTVAAVQAGAELVLFNSVQGWVPAVLRSADPA